MKITVSKFHLIYSMPTHHFQSRITKRLIFTTGLDLPATTCVPNFGFEENRIPIRVRSGKVQIGGGTPVEPQRISQDWRLKIADNCLALGTRAESTKWQEYVCTCHCCYHGAFQEVNILINRAHLVNVKLVLTELLYGKNYFSITIKVISNLTNKHGIILSGQTFVQKWL